MANFLSKDEIEKLLSQVNENSEITDTGTSEEEKSAQKSISYFTNKVFKRKTKPAQRFTFGYKSPVIKREDTIYSPTQNKVVDSTKTIVYTLEYYRLKH